MNDLFKHGLQLFLHYRRLILWTVVASTLIAAAASAFLLTTKPQYKAAATLVMTPTDAELAYAQGTGGASTDILTQTHIEYLTSRTVAENVLDKLGPASRLQVEDGAAAANGAAAQKSGGGPSFLTRFRRILNSGTFVELEPRERQLNKLMKGIDVKAQPRSFILRIEMTSRSPEYSAMVANALADAYLEQSQQQLEDAALGLESFLEDRFASRQDDLQGTISRELETKRELDLVSYEQQRSFLQSALNNAKESDVKDSVEIRTLETQIEAWAGQKRDPARQTLLAKLDEQIALGQARLTALKSGRARRSAEIAQLDRELDSLLEKERELMSFRTEETAISRDMAELRDRLFDIDLTRSSDLARVRLIDPAVPPNYPSSPLVLSNTITGLFAGVLLAIFAVAGLDTISNKVTTEVDLQRVTGTDVIGTLNRNHLTKASGITSDAKESRNLRTLGGLLERRLSILGAFDEGKIAVTGMLGTEELTRVTATIAAALASNGRDVQCDLPAGHGIPDPPQSLGNLRFGSGAGRELSGNAAHIRSLPAATSAAFRWSEIDTAAETILCVVNSAQSPEDVVASFLRQTEAKDVDRVGFVLLA